MEHNACAMEKCITASEAKRKYIMISPIVAPNVSAMEECITPSEAKRNTL